MRWFRANRREHPWRRDRSPYRVWLAEVMLQQTRIAAVIPYYEKFLARFPNVESLARAPEQEVLRLWAGLGYYSRARNLQRAAREIVAKHSGEFPDDFAAALALPGVGRYTAAAVLSIAFDAPHAVLDGNVARVLARLDAIRGDLRAPQRWKKLEAAAQTLLAPKAAGDWNQAMMELGETICTPKSPQCSACPVARWCEARKRGLVDAIPARAKEAGKRLAAHRCRRAPRFARAHFARPRSRRARRRTLLAHVAIPCRGIRKKSGGRVSRPLARAFALRSTSAHRAPSCKARRDISRHHASAILRCASRLCRLALAEIAPRPFAPNLPLADIAARAGLRAANAEKSRRPRWHIALWQGTLAQSDLRRKKESGRRLHAPPASGVGHLRTTPQYRISSLLRRRRRSTSRRRSAPASMMSSALLHRVVGRNLEER